MDSYRPKIEEQIVKLIHASSFVCVPVWGGGDPHAFLQLNVCKGFSDSKRRCSKLIKCWKIYLRRLKIN